MNYSRVEKLVIEAEKLIKEKAELSVNKKGENDYVTDVDVAISTFLKNRLKELYPEVDFFSEEETGRLSNNCWILDPIDGTTNLVFGYKLSSISLAHYYNGEVKYGIVYNPFYKELFTAIKNKGSFLNHKKKLRISNRDIGSSLIEFGAGSTHKELADENFKLVLKIFKDCVDVRRICSSALDLCYIADGRIDGYFEKVLKPWDFAAGSLILEEAGGILSNYEGKELDYSGKSSLIAGNKKVHKYLLKTLTEYYTSRGKNG